MKDTSSFGSKNLSLSYWGKAYSYGQIFPGFGANCRLENKALK